MRSDFDLIVHRLPTAPEVKLYFIGDLHAGAIEANTKGWDSFVHTVLSEPHSYLCILGDMMNNATRSSVSNVFDDAMSMYPRPREQKKYLVNSLSPLTERILCIVPGNHEGRSTKDADDEPLYDVACKLDLEDVYRPNIAFMKLSLGGRSDGAKFKPMQVYTVAVTHGAGGGIYTVTQRSMTVISCCSWLNYGGYAMKKMLLPAQAQDPEQPQTVILSGQRDKRYIKTVW